MKKIKEKLIKNKIIVSIVILVVLVAVVIGVSYSFVGDLIEKSQITNVNATAGSMENFTYTPGIDLTFVGTDVGYSGTTTPTVNMKAGTNTTTIDSTYNVYFSVIENNFTYSDQENKQAEILLKVVDPTGTEVTTIDGLTYTTSEGVSGFDVTTLNSFVQIQNNYPISTNDTVSGVTQSWTFTLTYVDLTINQAGNNDKSFKAQIILKDGSYQDTLSNLILANNGGKESISTRFNSSRAAVSQEFYDSQTEADKAKYEVTNGLYQTQDDLGTSYFFRGYVDNNWVEFAGYYWRIVRINGDNTVKLIYSGVTPPTDATKYVMTGSGTRIYTPVYNDTNDPAEKVGYMYTLEERQGSSVSSTAKINLDDWYGGNLKYYDDLIADTIFCNDRSLYSGIGFGSDKSYFGTRGRLISSLEDSPGGSGATFICPEEADKYSVETSIGNGLLTFPIGLITADEVVLAGSAWGVANSNYYLYTYNIYWTLSPYNYDGSWTGYDAKMFVVGTSGALNGNTVTNLSSIRPVISLKSDALAKGSGTWYDPYVVITD